MVLYKCKRRFIMKLIHYMKEVTPSGCDKYLINELSVGFSLFQETMEFVPMAKVLLA
jgi:hypothetical protein